MADDNLLAGDEFIKRSLEIRDSMSEIRSFTKDVNTELRAAGDATVVFATTFNSISTSADQVAKAQRLATESVKGTKAALQEQAKQQDNVRKLNIQINELYERARAKVDGPLKEALLAQAQNLANARDNAKDLASTYGQIAQEAAKLDKSSQYFDALGGAVKDLPGLSVFQESFAKAAASARKIRVDGGSGLEAFKGGAKALGQGLGNQFMNLFGPAGAIFGAVKAIKFFVDLLVSAQKNTVQIARDMSITRASAENIRQSFIDISANTTLTAVNSEKLIIAQKQLADIAGITNVQSAETLVNQVRLTERLGVGAEEAAKFNFAFEAFGKNAEVGLDTVIATENSLREATGTGVNLGQAISEAAKAGGQVLLNAKGGMSALAGAVLEAKRLGINLEESKKIASGLLDFESSIQSELEAELLTGKNLNLELAREKALRGDIVGASKAVLEQVGSIEEFQKLNVIQQNALAKSIGLTADELADSLLLQTNLKRQGEEYLKVYREQGAEAAKQFANQYGFSQIQREELDKTVTAQQAFEEALAKSKDQFTGLVSSGVLDGLVDALTDFVDFLNTYGFGREASIKRAQEAGSEIRSEKGIDQRAVDQAVQAVESKSTFWGALGMKVAGILSGNPALAKSIEFQQEARITAAQSAQARLQNAENFKLNTGGSAAAKSSKGVEDKIDELITVTKSKGNVYLDGNKVGNTLAQGARGL
jgi:hypothetical protein